MYYYRLIYKYTPNNNWRVYTTTAVGEGEAITNLLKDEETVYDYRIISQEEVENNNTNITYNLFKLIGWIVTMALVLWVVQQK